MRLYTLASGSSGNCTVVSSGNTHIIVDAGISARRMTRGLEQIGLLKKDIAGILVTHEHVDHISGLDVFLRRNDLKVYASQGTGQELLRKLPHLHNRIHTFVSGTSFALGEVEVSSFPTCHDTVDSVGYLLSDGKVRLGIATDLGYVSKDVQKAVEGLDFLLLEANYDPDMLQYGPYPAFLKQRICSKFGHLSNVARGGARQIVLAHLSAENNGPEQAMRTVRSALEQADFTGSRQVALDVAPRAEISLPYTVGG